MELKMEQYQLPEQIQFNYEELKQELTDKVSMYETMVYTDDQIQEAKKDKANLNKLKKALNDERIRQEREYMKPFNVFKSQINEIISIIDKPVAVIDKQVKEFEEKKKQEKMDEIKNFWNSCDVPEGLALEEIFDQKWLNASTSMKSIHDSINASITKFNEDMESLSNLPEYSFEAKQVYISTLDVGKALNEANRLSEMAKKKAEHEASMKKIAEEQKAKEYAQPVVPETIHNAEPNTDVIETVSQDKMWVSFKALLTTEDATALKEFLNSRNIEFKPI